MKKIFFATALFCAVSAFGQMTFDRQELLKSFAMEVCNCIDSISGMYKNSTDVSQEISECIKKHVITYQMINKILSIDTTRREDVKIEISSNPQSAEYIKYYNEIEKILLENCPAVRSLLASSNREGLLSYSSNPKALKEYDIAMTPYDKGNYKKALNHFEKAVKIDGNFAFAWDNIGMCYRKLGNYKKAIEAYKKSLEIDPFGEMPLVNLPIVYQLNKQLDRALEAYKELQEIYPQHAESYYGAGRILLLMGSYEESLRQMCKAYWAYVKEKSPYRSDAEQNINLIYNEMVKQGKEKEFFDIMEENNINLNIQQ